jgi:hypothetical protein
MPESKWPGSAEFAKKFKIDNYEMKEVRDVFEWLKLVMERDIKRQEKWLEASRKERKQMEDLKVKGSDIDWDKDTLARIPALKDIQKKLGRQNSGASNHKNGSPAEGKLSDAIHPSEQWIVELIKSKKNISEIDVSVLKNVAIAMEAATVEEATVSANLKKMKTDKEYVLNSIRFIDQEEAKAVRSTGKGVVNGRRNNSELENGSLLESSESSTPRAAAGTPKSKIPSPTRSGSSSSSGSKPPSPGAAASPPAPPAVPKRVHRAIPKPASPAPPPPAPVAAAPAAAPAAVSDGVTL